MGQTTFPYVLTYDKEKINIPKEAYEGETDLVLTATDKAMTGMKYDATYYSDANEEVTYVFKADGTATASGVASSKKYTYTNHFVYEDGKVIGAISYSGKYLYMTNGSTYTSKELTEVDVVARNKISFSHVTDGAYASTSINMNLVKGATYIVERDGVEYTCIAREVRLESSTTSTASTISAALGNVKVAKVTYKKLFNGTVITTEPETQEPFFINGSSIYTLSADSEHTVRIYQKKLM